MLNCYEVTSYCLMFHTKKLLLQTEKGATPSNTDCAKLIESRIKKCRQFYYLKYMEAEDS